MYLQNYIGSKLQNLPKIKRSVRSFIKLTNFILNKPVVSGINNPISEDLIAEYNKSREFGYQRYLCHAPFSSLYFKTNGDVVACCKNTTEIYGNVKDTSLTDIWHSAIKTELQNKLKTNQLEPGCGFCMHQLEHKNFSGVHARIHDQPFFKETYKFPNEITFEISNTCNLECIMCSGEYSSSIRKNRELIPPLKNNYPADFFEQLHPFLRHLKVARFQGGEPFLIDDYIKILEYLKEHNKNCRIYIQTNGTIYNSRVKKILEHNKIHLSISMDSLEGKQLEHIRKNLKYSVFKDNLTKFTEISERNKYTLNINFCLMNDNWKEIPQLFEFCYDNSYSLNIIPIDYPSILSLGNLSQREINDIEKYIIKHTRDKHKKKFSIIYNSLINSLSKISEKAKKRDEVLHFYKQKEIDELYEIVQNYLKERRLEGTNIDRIITNYKTQLNPLLEKKQKIILANNIINNFILNEVDSNIEFYNERFTLKLLEFFNHELNEAIK